MANRTIKIFGHNHADNTAFTVSWNGTEVFNGAISGTVCDYADVWGGDTCIPKELLEFTYNNADDTVESNNALSITVSAGEACVGNIYDIVNNDNAIYEGYPTDGKPPAVQIDGKWYWIPGGGGVYHDGSELEADAQNAITNMNTFAIDGNAVVAADIIGVPADFTFDGYDHHLVSGQVFTATVRVYKALVASVDNAKWGVNPL